MRGHSGAVDKHIGARLRAARLETGQSQTQVAEALGVAFQQIQKYESGINRVSAATLYDLSQLLDKPVQFFFDGLPRRRRRPSHKRKAKV